jgi:hypothetical protein
MREVSRDDKWENEPDEAPMEDPRLDKETAAEDPFSPENVGVVQTITLLRIYDVLIADFMARYPKAGEKLMERHARGGFMAPPPAFNPDEVEQYEDDHGGS